MPERDFRAEEKAKEMRKLIEDVASPMNRVPKEVIAEMAVMHRTHQQNFTRLCVAWLNHLASLKEGQFDMRNEDSVRLAKKFAAAVPEDERYLSYI